MKKEKIRNAILKLLKDKKDPFKTLCNGSDFIGGISPKKMSMVNNLIRLYIPIIGKVIKKFNVLYILVL